MSQTGTSGACVDDRALGGAGGIEVSADGAFVYVASFGSDAVADVLARSGNTGARAAHRHRRMRERDRERWLVPRRDGARSREVLSLSPDGSSVYVAAETSDAIAVLSRDGTTGTLTPAPGRAGCVSDTGTAGACSDGSALDAARAVSVSADGRSIYAASFGSSAISIFARDPHDGSSHPVGRAANAAATVTPATAG